MTEWYFTNGTSSNTTIKVEYVVFVPNTGKYYVQKTSG